MKNIKLLIIIAVFITGQTTYGQATKGIDYLEKIGITDSLYSQILKEQRTIFVQMPLGYNPQSQQKYPVAFILDGEVLLPTVNDVQNYYSGGFTPEMILVGISNDKNRVRDLTTSKIDTKYGMPFTQENGQADKFLEFIEKELIPYIENNYPVTNYRTLIGHSYGGLFTIYTLINSPELFANYLAIDPSLDWDDQKLIKEAKSKISKNNLKGKSLFISLSGQLHMQNSSITIENVMNDKSDFTLFARSNIEFSNLIKENYPNTLAYIWKFYPNDIHGTVAFPSLMDGLISMFKWYQMENTDKINSFDTPKDELYSIVKYREKKLQDHFAYFEAPYPEELFNMSGYMNLEMQQFDKAKMYFEFAIEYFPKSANAYDSMAEFYEAKNDIKNALKYLQKACELSDTKYFKNRLKQLKEKK